MFYSNDTGVLPPTIAQWLGRPLWVRWVVGLRLGRAIPKAIKLLAAPLLMLTTKGSARKIQEGR